MKKKSKDNSHHQLNTVYVDFKIVVELLKSGYKFDDSDAPRVLGQMEKCLTVLKSEMDRLDLESKNINSHSQG